VNGVTNSIDRSRQAPCGPLAGVRVLELGSLIAGPFATRMMAEFGADVIKVEPPGTGDPLRDWGLHRCEGRPLWWPLQSRNKRLITLDLRRTEGQDLCRRLARCSDVVVENFRPGTLERWELGPERLLEENPGLIIARISGFGQTGPYAGRPGFASVGEAMGGLRYINGNPGDAPPRAGMSLGDSLAGMFALQGILLALHHRTANGGPGQIVDASILESCFALLDQIVPEYGKLGVIREPSGTVLPHVAPSNVYRSRDEKWMVIAANGENLWRRLCVAMERSDLLSDERYRDLSGRVQRMEELDAAIAEWAGRHDAAEIERILSEAQVVFGPVYTVADLFADPHVQARDMLLSVEDPELGDLTMPGIVPKLSETPGAVRHAGAWELGAHNREIYGGLLGIGDDELEALSERGVI
jgi:crotonobetainyl-CoA:carnitine CoA-transferase CaiB-like acyl-CoA transferase